MGGDGESFYENLLGYLDAKRWISRILIRGKNVKTQIGFSIIYKMYNFLFYNAKR